MLKTVLCSDCGHKFTLEDDDGDYTPDSCPQCDKLILEVRVTPTSEEMLAQVEE